MAGPIIITRAEPGNRETALRLGEAELPYLCAPMLELVATQAVLPSLERVQGLLFTSANGVRAFCNVSGRRDLTAWCVGPATLAAASEAGFAKCEHGDGNSDDLANLVARKARADAGSLLHIANAAAAGKLAMGLRGAGFEVIFAPLYQADPVQKLSSEVKKALEMRVSCVVLVHSAKGAVAFREVSDGIDFAPHLLVAVSKAAAEPLLARGFGQVVCAERPNEMSLISALFSAYSTL